MTVTVELKWQSEDSTLFLNNKVKALFSPGILTDGLVSPVSGQLKVTVDLFTAINVDGMYVTSDIGEVLDVPANQTSIINLLVKYNIGSEPTVEFAVTEASAFLLLTDKDARLVFGEVTVPNLATQVLSSHITYFQRTGQDKRPRSGYRGRIATTASLPTATPSLNAPGDFFVVTQGVGDTAEIWAWNGSGWDFITNSSGVAADLASHRANLFTDEKHLTDDQADAALGSSGAPSLANPYVTSLDPRVPTQSENDALVGSDGAPSSSNRYVTQEWQIAMPSFLVFPVPPGSSIPAGLANGPFFVGTGAVNTANQYFALVESTTLRGYLNSANAAPQVIGVFTDALLTTPLVPSVDADAFGFYAGDVFLQLSSLVSSGFRLLYGKKADLGTVTRNFSVTPSPGDEYVPSLVAQEIVGTKGRAFNDPVPAREQNINLRVAIDSLQAYMGSVLETNVVASDEDYSKLSGEPVIGAYFDRNVGVANVPTFLNSGLASLSYNSASGVVTYGSPVVLTSAAVGNIFRDGAGVFYLVTAIGVNSVTIQDLNSGLAPSFGSVTTSVGTADDGSILVNFNPRDLLISEMKATASTEVVPVTQLVESPEFSRPDGLVAYCVERHPGYKDPRVVFYGGWENFPAIKSKTYVRNRGSLGRIDITGWFTSVSLWVKMRSASPNLNVSVNRESSSVVSTSGGGAAAAASVTSYAQYARVRLATGLSTTAPNNIQATISAATADPLEIYAIELVRDDNPSVALLETGVAFQNTNILTRNTLNFAAPVSTIATDRGGRQILTLAENSFGNSLSTLTSIPTIVSTGSGSSFTVSANSMAAYQVNDLVYVQDAATSPTVVEIRRISALTSTVVTLSSSSSLVNPYFAHLANTSSSPSFVNEEEEIARYSFTKDFVNLSELDFEDPDSGPRFVVAKDTLTVVSGSALSVVTTGLNGAPNAVRLDSGGLLVISALCTRIDLLTAHDATASSVSRTIDGSPAITDNWAGGAARRQTLFANGAYTNHEVVISGGGGNLAVTDIILWGPKKPALTGSPVESADFYRVSSYYPSSSALISNPYTYPVGAVFFEATSHFSFLTGAGANPDWSLTQDATKHLFGQYLATANDAAYAEFYFLGESFELQFVTGPDHGIFVVTVDGSPLESAGGTIVGDYTGNQKDAYSATYGRSNIGAFGLPYGYHRLRAAIKNPRTKNGSSTDYRMAFLGCFVTNAHGRMSYGMDQGGTFSGLVDARRFLGVKAAELPSSDFPADSENRRAGFAAATLGSTSLAVTYSSPMPDSHYVLSVSWSNQTDTYPDFQPVTITSKTLTGFTASWNSPLVSSNMVLYYLTDVVN